MAELLQNTSKKVNELMEENSHLKDELEQSKIVIDKLKNILKLNAIDVDELSISNRMECDEVTELEGGNVSGHPIACEKRNDENISQGCGTIVDKSREVFLRIDNIAVTWGDYNDLIQPGRMINDNVVELIINQLKEFSNQKTHIFNTFYFLTTMNDNNIHARKYNHYREKQILIILLFDIVYFYLYVVYLGNKGSADDLFERNCILFLDSLNPSSKDHSEFLSNLGRWLDVNEITENIPSLECNDIIQLNVPQQNTNDCGLCMLYFMEKILKCYPRSIDDYHSLFIKEEMHSHRQEIANRMETLACI